MAKKIPVLDEHGKKTEEMTVKDDILKVKVDDSLIHHVIRAHMAGERTGTASTKSRGEVRGGGVKPWRQKGTGRARAGSIRSPLWAGGGVIFGPTPRDFSIKLPKKARRQALKCVLSEKIKEGALKIMADVVWDKPKTKQAVKMIDAFKMEGKILAIFKGEPINVYKSFVNLPEVKIISTDQVNAYDILNSDEILTTKKAFEILIEERL